MPINKVRLKNFQAHSDTTLLFEQGVNVIVGPTDSGKSSTFRALRWLVEHKSIGPYAKFGTKETEVLVSTDDAVVMRFKRPGANGYKVNDLNDFVAVGTTQPSQVAQALGLSPINLQGQHDAPFLLGLAPGQFARELNAIVDLGVIDKTTGEAKRILRERQNQHTAYQKIEEDYFEKGNTLGWVPLAELDLASLAIEEKNIHIKRDRADQLTKAVDTLEALDGPLAELTAAQDALAALAKSANAIDTGKDKRDNLEYFSTQARTMSVSIKDFKGAQTQLESMVLLAEAVSAAEIKQSRLLAASATLKWCSENMKAIEAAEKIDEAWEPIEAAKLNQKQWSTLHKTWTQVEAWKNEAADLQAQENEIRATTPTCPTCGKAL